MSPESPGLAFLICSPSIDRPESFVTPLIHAIAARALDIRVEIHFAGPAVRLLADGVADALYPTPAREKSLGVFLREASASGVSLLACSMARANWLDADCMLISECDGTVGATAFVARSFEPGWRTMVF
ncbi:DsrE family protein [Propionivibrio dicarboxylicus]|uniref:Predicted peroxiredoxin n=1 Tax=Propionivibrio dicarboxylicus TaxID=83767 RepID=A0A1G8MNF6_9RHOO|nr:DsrE family protein [Propionivibrio dicarboxylicus]SDI69491.1 Predicted peroxiredoxin [Propionivibrio dicarboxylicus]